MSHHAALRYRYSPTESGWEQRLDPSPPPQLVEIVDLTGLSQIRQQEAMREHAARTHASLNLSSGPLIRVVLFRRGASLSQILIVVHHLVIDGVSLRILVGDLETAYRQLAQGLAIRLPDASTTYARWARRLRSYAQSAELASQRDYWASVFDPAVPPLPVDHPSQRHEGRESDLEITPSLLTPEETQRLLQDLPRVLQTQINDVLLAALAQAFYQWSGHATLLVDLEGHGREALFDDVDLSRTVGWFTTIFPVRLQGDISDSRDALLAARAALRRIPSRGIGYGLLRYLSPDRACRSKLAECPPPDVMFNYLGQFDRASSPDTLFEIHDNVDFGPLHGPRGKRSHLFEIIARVVGGRLRLDWMYPRTAYRGESVARLIELYQAALRKAIALTASLAGTRGIHRAATGDRSDCIRPSRRGGVCALTDSGFVPGGGVGRVLCGHGPMAAHPAWCARRSAVQTRLAANGAEPFHFQNRLRRRRVCAAQAGRIAGGQPRVALRGLASPRRPHPACCTGCVCRTRPAVDQSVSIAHRS